MVVSFEQGEINLRSLAAWYASNVGEKNRNEATTRMQLIDQLFFECLGWNRGDCIAEENLEGTIADYSFCSPEKLRLLVVEAKREGLYFELPVGGKIKKLKIQYFLDYTKDVGNAIQQAAEYCQKRGAPFGAVSNGHQIVAFIASRIDGRSPLEGRALVFDSLDCLLSDFRLAWQCLSPAGVAERRLSDELQDIVTAPVPDKLSASVPNYPRYRRRNLLQTELQILSGLFIEGFVKIPAITDERKVLKETYCESGALSQYAAVSKELLRTRYSEKFQEAAQLSYMEPATSKKGPNPEIFMQPLTKVLAGAQNQPGMGGSKPAT